MANESTRRSESYSSSKELGEPSISGDRLYNLLKIEVLNDIQGDVKNWAKRWLWAIGLFGLLGGWGFLEFRLRDYFAKDIERAKVASLAAEQSANEARSAAKEARDQLRLYGDELSDIRGQFINLRKGYSNMGSTVRAIRSDYEQLTQEIHSVREQMDGALEQAGEMAAQLEEILAKSQNAESEIDTSILAIKESIEDVNGQIRDHVRKLDLQEKELAMLATSLDSLNERSRSIGVSISKAMIGEPAVYSAVVWHRGGHPALRTGGFPMPVELTFDVELTGNNLGSEVGEVYVTRGPDSKKITRGLGIESWTDTSVSARIQLEVQFGEIVSPLGTHIGLTSADGRVAKPVLLQVRQIGFGGRWK